MYTIYLNCDLSLFIPNLRTTMLINLYVSLYINTQNLKNTERIQRAFENVII